MQYVRYTLITLAVGAVALATGQLVLGSVGAEGEPELQAGDEAPSRWGVGACGGPTHARFGGQEEPELQVGDEAPEVAIAEYIQGEPVQIHPDEDEEQEDTEEEEERPIHVVEFWATWCPPCVVSIPHLTELQERYEEDNVVIVGVTNEDAEDVQPFVEDKGEEMAYTVAIDEENKTGRAYMEAAGVQGIPWAFVVDREGELVWHGHAMEVEAGIQTALGEEEEEDA